jgi:ABC-type nitrate/sulfonate/bicarbonate transport system substrate-binding protein
LPALRAERELIATCRADAASVSEPYIASFVGVGRVFCYAYNAIAPTFMISGYFTTQDWARANLDTVRKFREAMRESALWANTHQAKSKVHEYSTISSSRTDLPSLTVARRGSLTALEAGSYSGKVRGPTTSRLPDL